MYTFIALKHFYIQSEKKIHYEYNPVIGKSHSNEVLEKLFHIFEAQ